MLLDPRAVTLRRNVKHVPKSRQSDVNNKKETSEIIIKVIIVKKQMNVDLVSQSKEIETIVASMTKAKNSKVRDIVAMTVGSKRTNVQIRQVHVSTSRLVQLL